MRVTHVLFFVLLTAACSGTDATTGSFGTLPSAVSSSSSVSTTSSGGDETSCFDSLKITRAGVKPGFDAHVTVTGLEFSGFVPAQGADYVRVWTPEVNGTLLGERAVNADFKVKLPDYGTFRIVYAIERRTGGGTVCQYDGHHFTVTARRPPTPEPDPEPELCGEPPVFELVGAPEVTETQSGAVVSIGTIEALYTTPELPLEVAHGNNWSFTAYQQFAYNNLIPPCIATVSKTFSGSVPEQEVDVCPNLEGNQTEVPEGYVVIDGLCVQPVIPSVDLCSNLEGDQETVPEGYERNEDGTCAPIPACETVAVGWAYRLTGGGPETRQARCLLIGGSYEASALIPGEGVVDACVFTVRPDSDDFQVGVFNPKTRFRLYATITEERCE